MRLQRMPAYWIIFSYVRISWQKRCDVASDVGDNLCNVENDVKRRFLYSGVFHYVNTHMYFILKRYNDNYLIMKLFCNTN